MNSIHAALKRALAICAVLTIAPLAHAQLNVEDIVGTITRGGEDVGSFEGALEDIQFRRQGGQIVAIGELTGDILNEAGEVVRSISRQVRIPLADIGAEEPSPGNCQVLFLALGPIDLNLLGLELHIDEIIVDLEANPAGGILGQLLCGLAGGLGLDLGGLIDDLLGGGFHPRVIDLLVDILNNLL